MKTIAVIRCAKNFSVLAERCKKSFEYFHPDIECVCAYSEDWREFLDGMGVSGIGIGKHFMYTATFLSYLKMCSENYELVINLDSDVVVTGRLDEMLVGDYDIGATQSASLDYYNSGVWSSTSKEFVRTNLKLNLDSHFCENWAFVHLVRYYKGAKAIVKVFDDVNEKVWYNERSRQWWNRLTVKDEKLYTPDREVKILHWAGGMGWGQEKRMSCSLFSDEVKQWLNKITDGTTFTDYDGKEFGEYLSKTYRDIV